MGTKQSQLFDWEHEPKAERPSAFAVLSTLGSLSAHQRAATPAAPLRGNAADADPRALRDPNAPAQITLSPMAMRWADALPGQVQPVQLCLLYPRIANRLALCWPDAMLTAKVFASLLTSSGRSTRRGFPPQIARELEALKRFSVGASLGPQAR